MLLLHLFMNYIKYQNKLLQYENIINFIKENFPNIIGYKKNEEIHDLFQLEEIIELKYFSEKFHTQETNINQILDKINIEIIESKNKLYICYFTEENNTKIDLELIDEKSVDGLYIIRHSLRNIMANSLKNIYQEKVFSGTGGVTEDGFFYDFTGIVISTKDFTIIENEMIKIIDSKIPITKSIISKKDFLKNNNNPLKVCLVNNISSDKIYIYSQGGFCDLSEGPNVFNTSLLPKNFKIIGVSEVIWEHQKVQRLKAIAFQSKQDLKEFEDFQYKNEKYDHRKIGKKMELKRLYILL